jgi:nitrous oxide reductase
MDRDRRAFLKTTSLAAAAAAAGLPAATEAVSQARSASAEMKELPKGLVLATLRRRDSYG